MFYKGIFIAKRQKLIRYYVECCTLNQPKCAFPIFFSIFRPNSRSSCFFCVATHLNLFLPSRFFAAASRTKSNQIAFVRCGDEDVKKFSPVHTKLSVAGTCRRHGLLQIVNSTPVHTATTRSDMSSGVFRLNGGPKQTTKQTALLRRTFENKIEFSHS